MAYRLITYAIRTFSVNNVDLLFSELHTQPYDPLDGCVCFFKQRYLYFGELIGNHATYHTFLGFCSPLKRTLDFIVLPGNIAWSPAKEISIEPLGRNGTVNIISCAGKDCKQAKVSFSQPKIFANLSPFLASCSEVFGPRAKPP